MIDPLAVLNLVGGIIYLFMGGDLLVRGSISVASYLRVSPAVVGATVVLTTSAAEPDVSRAYELHANSYLVKPVDYSKFTRLMHQLGFYWLEWNERPNL